MVFRGFRERACENLDLLIAKFSRKCINFFSRAAKSALFGVPRFTLLVGGRIAEKPPKMGRFWTVFVGVRESGKGGSQDWQYYVQYLSLAVGTPAGIGNFSPDFFKKSPRRARVIVRKTQGPADPDFPNQGRDTPENPNTHSPNHL